jgi:hypothetical protein
MYTKIKVWFILMKGGYRCVSIGGILGLEEGFKDLGVGFGFVGTTSNCTFGYIHVHACPSAKFV